MTRKLEDAEMMELADQATKWLFGRLRYIGASNDECMIVFALLADHACLIAGGELDDHTRKCLAWINSSEKKLTIVEPDEPTG